MNIPRPPVGILVIGHGSPRAEANRGFIALVERMALRLGSSQMLPAFFSIARPDILDQLTQLVAQGVRRVLLMPYFLYSGQHVTVDIPALLAKYRERFPGVELEMLPTLENEPMLEDMVVERLTPLAGCSHVLPQEGAAIERRSYAWIDRQVADWSKADPRINVIVRRVIHATADVSFGRTLRIHPEAIVRAKAALASRAPVFCDVKMLQAGMTKIPGEVVCAIDCEEVLAQASQKGITRAAAAMDRFASHWDGAIVAIGNAPTALWKVLELAGRGRPSPAVVVGLPVGFVGARESKQALLESELCYITNVGARGGSPVAAAVVNALATLEKEG